jgi:threonine/homoserine/homoserine lactone efflux protein
MSVEFFLVSLILALVPGTGVVFTLACAMAQGLRGALWGAVAGAVGVIPHLVAAGLGLSALLIAWPLLYDGLRLLGGAYLIWLAVQAWQNRHAALEMGSAPATGAQIVTQGALINLLNPKLTLFFVSFLPQFVPPTDPAPMLTMGMMGLVLIAQTFVVFLAYGALAARAGHLLRRQPRIMVLFQTGIAALFAGLGLRVILGGR